MTEKKALAEPLLLERNHAQVGLQSDGAAVDKHWSWRNFGRDSCAIFFCAVAAVRDALGQH